MEHNAKSIQGVIEDTYAAALGEQPWDAALHGVRRLTGARIAGIVTLNAAGRTAFATAVADDPDWAIELQQSYNSEFHRYDPSEGICGNWPVGRWFDDREWTLPAQRTRSVFHQEFLRPRGVGNWEGVFINRTEQVMRFLSLQAALDRMEAPSFRHSLRQIEPHLVRAVRMQEQLQALQGKVSELESALDALNSPLFLLDDSRRLLRTNAAARTLMAQEPSLRFVKGRFEPSHMDAEAWQEACKRGVLAIQRNAPQKPLVLTLNPLPAGSHLAKDWQRPLTLMLAAGVLSTAERQQNLCAIYGLTQAEAEVCTLICHEGLSPQECSDERGVSIGTIRSQIKSIYLKTGVARLTELVRLASAI